MDSAQNTNENRIQPPAPPQYLLSSVDNALRLLLLFKQRQQVRLSEAREYLGVGQSTAHRLLAMLVYRGFVSQNPATRIYEPGQAMFELGMAAIQHTDLRAIAHPILEELARDSHETTVLAVLQGSHIRLIDGIEPERSLRAPTHIGRVVPAHASSAGKALLSSLSKEELYELYPNEALEQMTDKTIATRTGLERDLAQVRKQDFATNIEESDDGISTLSVAIRGPRHEAVAAISILAPSLRVDDKRTRQLVRHVMLARSAIEEKLYSSAPAGNG